MQEMFRYYCAPHLIEKHERVVVRIECLKKNYHKGLTFQVKSLKFAPR